MLQNTAFYKVSKELLSLHPAYCSNGFSFSYGPCITQQSCCLVKLVKRKINLSVYICACISLLFWKMTVTVVTVSKSLKWLLCNEQFLRHCTHRFPQALNPACDCALFAFLIADCNTPLGFTLRKIILWDIWVSLAPTAPKDATLIHSVIMYAASAGCQALWGFGATWASANCENCLDLSYELLVLVLDTGKCKLL